MSPKPNAGPPTPAPATPGVAPAWLAWGALNAGMAVAMGAVASHATSAGLDPRLLQLAVVYQMSHALGTLVLASIHPHLASTTTRLGLRAGLWLMAAGLLLFCGSLYATGLGHPLPRTVAFLTPVGGSCLILAWLMAAVGALIGCFARR